MRKFSIIVPAYHTPDLVHVLIKTFEKFRPNDVENHYVIVENSNDSSYKDHTLSLAESVTWVQNPKADASKMNAGTFIGSPGSTANVMGIMAGLEYIDDDFVFIAHCDVCITSQSFYDEIFNARDKGYDLIGTSIDNSRINAIHQSGFYVKTDLISKVDLMPQLHQGQTILDACDSITKYCRDNSRPILCFKNTFNMPSLVDTLDEPWKSFHVDRCIDSSGNVMFMHLGRGVPKSFNAYNKPNRVYLPGWNEFYLRYLSNEN
tara:strand:- start:5582 stop:6367 length:786 start_codon:yes stop_codon:yes gene_type:complete